MPNITLFALLLAVFELTTGILIFSKGRYVKIGLAASVLFNLFLVQLGLGYPGIQGSGKDFLLNRLPNLLFGLLQCPLFLVHFDKSFPGLLRARLRYVVAPSQYGADHTAHNRTDTSFAP